MEIRATRAHAPARLIALAASACALALSASVAAAADAPAGQWPAVGGSNLFQRYSGLNDINRANVAGLKIVWTRPGLEPLLLAEYPQLSASNTPTSYFRSTPIVVDGIVYASNAAGLVEAFDGATGKTIWTQQPFSKATADVAGSSARGVAMWRSGNDVRIISGRGSFLYATDAKTGKPVTSFGEQGRINLSEDGRRGAAAGAPLIIGDIIGPRPRRLSPGRRCWNRGTRR
jgi:quinoprotein glucose dehydrogenase